MKILLANKYLYPKGGAENSFFVTAELLKRNGHEVSFFSMRHPKNVASEYEKYFISNVDYESGGIGQSVINAGRLLYSFEAKRKIDGLIRHLQPDVAHLNNIYHQISPSILHVFKKYRIPVVMSLRDYKLVCATYAMLRDWQPCESCSRGKYYNCARFRCVDGSFLKSMVNTVEMYLHHKLLHIYDLVDVFISPSRFLKDKVAEMGFKGKVSYLPNCVDPGDFNPSFEVKGDTICYVGRLSKEKGIATLIEAVKGLDVQLKIIGDGPLREVIEQSIAAEGITNVTLLGHMSISELKEQVAQCVCAIVPSEWYENNPRSVIEAFALGKPVIGARIGGIPELVKDGETGLTFTSGDANDLRAKIEQLMADREAITRMGRNARAFVEKELNADTHYEKLMDVYQYAIDTHKKARR